MKRKFLFITLGVILSVIILVLGGIWYMSTQPLYMPGMVRSEKNLNAPLTPPEQLQNSETWLVEPGIELHHFVVGDGRNVLVIHGGPGLPFLEPMSGLAPLTGEFQFHYYDQRGCGESTRPIDRFESQNMYENMIMLDKTLGLGAQIADIERIRQILGDDKLILIGHSWGGFLASLYAGEFPDHVEALILISPANMLVMPQPDEESDLFTSVREKLPADQQAEFDEFMAEYMDFNTLFQKSEEDLVAMNEQFGEYYIQVVDVPVQTPPQGRSGGWMVWAQYVSMGQRHDYRDALKAVTAPVLVIHGANDLQSEAASRIYQEAIPNAEFVVIESASHFSFEEQPDEFAKIVADFLFAVK
ncbi:MAG: alpha/beta fold hydrolase [Chloroflexi bacterium]|nr:MAG: alpha/beta fold hydrolase [Chloroflexota bacterium]